MNEININISINKINEYFPNLNKEEKELLITLHNNLLISIKNQYHINIFTENDYIDSLFILLPYINTEKINELKNIKKLEEIYLSKEENINYDLLNNKAPKYIFSNIEYNICNDKENKETNFNIHHLINNFKLLKYTIEITASRLFVNWGTIFPIKFINEEYFVNNIINNYSYFFIKDDFFINNDNLTFINYNKNIEENKDENNEYIKEDIDYINYKHLSLYTIHNSIYYYFNNKLLTDINNILNIFKDKTKKTEENDNIIKILKKIKNDKIYEYKSYQELDNFYNNENIKKNLNYIIMVSLYLLSINGTLNIFEYKYDNIKDMIENNKSPLKKEEIKEYDNNIYFLTKTTYKELDEMEDDMIKHNINDIEERGYNNNTLMKDIIDRLEKIEKKEEKTKEEKEFERKYRQIRKLTDNEKKNLFNVKHIRDLDIYIGYNKYYSLMWISQLKFYYKFINCRVMYLTGGTGVGKSTQIPKLILYGLNTFDFNNNGKLINTQPRQKPTITNAKWIGKQLGIFIEDFNANPYIQFKHGDQNTSSMEEDENYYVKDKEKNEYKKIRYNGEGLLFKVCTDKLLFNDILKYPIYTKKNYSKNVFDCIMIDETHEHNVNMDLILSILKPIIMLNNTLRLIIVSATMENDEPYYRRFYKDIIDNHKYPNRNINQYINKFYLDRRIHISEPGKDTTYNIIEHYEKNFINNEEERNLKIKEILMKILTNKETKDILVFKSGQKEIKNCINYLNNFLPNDVICIPYISSSIYANKNIPIFLDNYNNNTVKNIHISKNEDILTTNYNLNEGNNNYNHVIFIGTNVIEASITIDSLTHVIDDGQQKVMIYDYKTKISQLTLMNIAEMNRKQRKGRVGRKADGTIYYLYPEHYLEKEKIQYKICNENLENYMFDLLIDNNTKKIITNNNTNLNMYLTQKYNSIEYLTKSRNNPITKDNLYEHNFNYMYLYDCYFKNLIIHPLENNIIRNIFGNVINQNDIYIDIDNNINYPIFKKYTFEDLINKYLSLNLIIDKHNLNDENNYIKSLFAKKLSSIIQNSKDTNIIQYSLMLLLGKKLNIYDDIVYIVFLLLNKNEEILKINKIKILNSQSEIYNLYLNFKYSQDENYNFNSINFNTFKNNIRYNLIIQLSNFIFDFNTLNNLSFYDKLSFILLISFNNNIFKKIPNVNKGINLFVPNNILTINNTILDNQSLNDNIIYIDCLKQTKNEISTTYISLLHSFDKIFLKYISNIIIFNYEKIKQNIKNIKIYDNDINIENYKLTLSYLLSLLRLIKFYHFDIYNNVKDININEIDCEDLIEPENYKHILFKSFCEEKKFELFIFKYIFNPIISNEHIIYYNISQNNNGIYLILHYLNKNSYIFINNLYLKKNSQTIKKQIKDLNDNDIKNIIDCYNSNDSEKLIDFNMILDNNIDKKLLKNNKEETYYLSCHTFNPNFNYLSTLHIRNGNYEKDLKDKSKYYALSYNNNSLQLNFNSNLQNAYDSNNYITSSIENKKIINLLINSFNECYNSFLYEI